MQSTQLSERIVSQETELAALKVMSTINPRHAAAYQFFNEESVRFSLFEDIRETYDVELVLLPREALPGTLSRYLSRLPQHE